MTVNHDLLMRKIKRHILIPVLLLIYLAVMTSVFGVELFRAGEYLRFFGIIGTELILIAGCYFFLKRRYNG